MTYRCNANATDIQFRGRFNVRSLGGHLPATLQPLIGYHHFLWIVYLLFSVYILLKFWVQQKKGIIIHSLLAGVVILLMLDHAIRCLVLNHANRQGKEIPFVIMFVSYVLHSSVLVVLESFLLLLMFG